MKILILCTGNSCRSQMAHGFLQAIDSNLAKETCPVFMGEVNQRLHLGFEDPSHAKGTDEIVLSEFRRVRDEIKQSFDTLYNNQIKHML